MRSGVRFRRKTTGIEKFRQLWTTSNQIAASLLQVKPLGAELLINLHQQASVSKSTLRAALVAWGERHSNEPGQGKQNFSNRIFVLILPEPPLKATRASRRISTLSIKHKHHSSDESRARWITALSLSLSPSHWKLSAGFTGIES